MNYYIYILASKRNGTLYIGITNNLLARLIEHKQKINNGFTSKYNVTKLVWYDYCEDVRDIINREKQIKKWNRKWKLKLIESSNPEWKDLYYEIGGTDEMLVPGFPLSRERQV